MPYKHKLPAEFKAKWLEALRSGKYEQGFKALRILKYPSSYSDEGSYSAFCCLGVAADVLDPFGWIIVSGCDGNAFFYGDKKWTLTGRSFRKINYAIDKALSQAHEFTGITAEGRLTKMNDTGKSFAEIADWIEENL